MNSNPITDQKPITSQSSIQLIRKSILIYIIFAVALPMFCIILGWRTLGNIGTGFIYGSLCLMLFGTLTLFGNTVPAQLSNLSLPKYSPPSTEPQWNPTMEHSGLKWSDPASAPPAPSGSCGCCWHSTVWLSSCTEELLFLVVFSEFD